MHFLFLLIFSFSSLIHSALEIKKVAAALVVVSCGAYGASKLLIRFKTNLAHMPTPAKLEDIPEGYTIEKYDKNKHADFLNSLIPSLDDWNLQNNSIEKELNKEQIIVVKNSHKPVGCASYYLLKNNDTHIAVLTKLVIKEDTRKKGVAKVLIKDLCNRLKQKKISCLLFKIDKNHYINEKCEKIAFSTTKNKDEFIRYCIPLHPSSLWHRMVDAFCIGFFNSLPSYYPVLS